MIRWLPNFLTLTRILCAITMLALVNQPKLLFFIFAVGALTDWLDGYFAKNYQLTSKLGEALDPIADKALVVCALLILMHYNNSLALFFAVSVIILREFIVAACRQLIPVASSKLKVTYLARVKTAVQMLGIATCFFGLAFNYNFYHYGVLLIIMSAFLTILTFGYYMINSYSVVESM